MNTGSLAHSLDRDALAVRVSGQEDLTPAAGADGALEHEAPALAESVLHRLLRVSA